MNKFCFLYAKRIDLIIRLPYASFTHTAENASADPGTDPTGRQIAGKQNGEAHMTRTDYANKLRDAGFRVRPLWQGKTEDPESPRFDLTCYSIFGLDGEWLTNMIVREWDDGLLVYFESQSNRIEGDIAFLRNLVGRKAASS